MRKYLLIGCVLALNACSPRPLSKEEMARSVNATSEWSRFCASDSKSCRGAFVQFHDGAIWMVVPVSDSDNRTLSARELRKLILAGPQYTASFERIVPSSAANWKEIAVLYVQQQAGIKTE